MRLNDIEEKISKPEFMVEFHNDLMKHMKSRGATQKFYLEMSKALPTWDTKDPEFLWGVYYCTHYYSDLERYVDHNNTVFLSAVFMHIKIIRVLIQRFFTDYSDQLVWEL